MAVDLGFDVQQRENGTVRVRTTGMGRRGRPEIELTDVTMSQVDIATDLLGRVAATVSERAVYSGQLMAVADDLSVELQECEHVPVGFLARAFGASDRTVMRITDAGRSTATGVLCGTARLRAREAKQRGDATMAARILHEALDAARSDDEAVTGERARAAVELSYVETDSARAIELLLQGLREDEVAQSRELGATFDAIRAFDGRRIGHQLQQIANVNLGLVEETATLDAGARVVPAPIWLRSEVSPDRAELAMTMIPGPWLRLYWHGNVRTELERGLLGAMAAEIFTALASFDGGIARMAYVVRETESTFALAKTTRRAAASPSEVLPHLFLASRVLAHVARLRAADLNRAQIAAAFGLNHDQEDIKSARDKSRRLRVKLAQWNLQGRIAN